MTRSGKGTGALCVQLCAIVLVFSSASGVLQQGWWGIVRLFICLLGLEAALGRCRPLAATENSDYDSH